MLLENVNSSLDAEETVSGHWSGKEGSNFGNCLESEMLKPEPENSYYEMRNMCFIFFSRNFNSCAILVSGMKRGLGNRNELRLHQKPKYSDVSMSLMLKDLKLQGNPFLNLSHLKAGNKNVTREFRQPRI